MRRKKRSFRTARTRSSRAFKTYRRKKGSSSSNKELVTIMVSSAVYGAGRQYVSGMLSKLIQPIVDKVPIAGLGNLSDELAMGTLSYFLAKGKIINNPTFKAIGKAGLTIESARIGEFVVDMVTKPTTNASAVQSFR